MIQLTKTSEISGESHTLGIPLSPLQYNLGLWRWENGMLIQDAFPTLSPSEREFIKSGITPEEWDRIFGTE